MWRDIFSLFGPGPGSMALPAAAPGADRADAYNRDRVESQIQRASRDMTPQQTARLRRTAHKKTFESYYNQAIEKDARSYAQA